MEKSYTWGLSSDISTEIVKKVTLGLYNTWLNEFRLKYNSLYRSYPSFISISLDKI